MSVLINALNYENFGIAGNLIREGIGLEDKDKDGKTALDIAKEKGYTDIILTIENERKRSKDNPTNPKLIRSIEEKDLQAVKILIAKGEDVDLYGMNYQTPLHHASLTKQVDIAELLIKAKADLNQKDIRGRTALHLATMCRCVEIVNLLIQSGADLDIANRYGQTALHLTGRMLSTERKSIVEIAQALVNAGANTFLKTKDGVTALDVANYYEAKDIVDVLKGAIK